MIQIPKAAPQSIRVVSGILGPTVHQGNLAAASRGVGVSAVRVTVHPASQQDVPQGGVKLDLGRLGLRSFILDRHASEKAIPFRARGGADLVKGLALGLGHQILLCSVKVHVGDAHPRLDHRLLPRVELNIVARAEAADHLTPWKRLGVSIGTVGLERAVEANLRVDLERSLRIRRCDGATGPHGAVVHALNHGRAQAAAESVVLLKDAPLAEQMPDIHQHPRGVGLWKSVAMVADTRARRELDGDVMLVEVDPIVARLGAFTGLREARAPPGLILSINTRHRHQRPSGWHEKNASQLEVMEMTESQDRSIRETITRRVPAARITTETRRVRGELHEAKRRGSWSEEKPARRLRADEWIHPTYGIAAFSGLPRRSGRLCVL